MYKCNGCFVRVQNKYNTETHILLKLYFKHEFMCSTDIRNIWILEIKFNCLLGNRGAFYC